MTHLREYEVAALRERIRSARKEVESLEHAMNAKLIRLHDLHREIEGIGNRVEDILQIIKAESEASHNG